MMNDVIIHTAMVATRTKIDFTFHCSLQGCLFDYVIHMALFISFQPPLGSHFTFNTFTVKICGTAVHNMQICNIIV